MMQQEVPTAEEIAEYQARLAEYTAMLNNSRQDRVLEWVASLLFAAIVLATWYFSSSLIIGLLVGAIAVAAMILGLFAVTRRRLKSSHEWLKANAHRFQSEKD